MSSFIFGRFFFALRQAGLPVGLSEWMTLMQAIQDGAVDPDLYDFYTIARAVLVKSEALFDTYDEVFAGVFGKNELPKKALEDVLLWLFDAKDLAEITPEMLAKMEALPLDELRRRFEERLREQDERHDGGNRWIGTGGTSPFGNAGMNPAGMRVGGSSGGKTAIQIASARRFREYRNDRVLDVRGMQVALKKLRRLSRIEGEPELDVEESIDKTCRNAGELELAFHPPRKNEARVLLLMDVGGSMDPYTRLVEQLFSAASSLDHWKKFEAFTFHNCPYAKVTPSRRKDGDKDILTADLMHERPKTTYLIMVGDAYMAPTELLEAFGSIEHWEASETPGIAWLHRLRSHFQRAVWLNPIPEKGWHGWTIKLIHQIFPMFPLTLEGIENAVDALLKRRPEPVPEIETLVPRLPRF
jgi:uncharacterized protein with von Willebrand factor type A (vWA) domain